MDNKADNYKGRCAVCGEGGCFAREQLAIRRLPSRRSPVSWFRGVIISSTVPLQEPVRSASISRVDTSGERDVHLLPARYDGGGKGGRSLVYTDVGAELLDMARATRMDARFESGRSGSKIANRALTVVSWQAAWTPPAARSQTRACFHTRGCIVEAVPRRAQIEATVDYPWLKTLAWRLILLPRPPRWASAGKARSGNLRPPLRASAAGKPCPA